jgi:hypothetical protein
MELLQYRNRKHQKRENPLKRRALGVVTGAGTISPRLLSTSR